MGGVQKAMLLIFVLELTLSTSSGQLMCFHCDDCDYAMVDIIQCGPDRPLLPFPETTTQVPPSIPTIEPETTTQVPPSIPTIEPETTTQVPPSIPTIEPETTTQVPPSIPTIEPETTTQIPPSIPTIEPETTTEIPPSIPTIEPETTTDEPETTTISTTPGGPILTPPTHPTFNPNPMSTTPSGPILTPPTHPTPLAPIGFGIVLPIQPTTQQYACLSVRRVENNRNIVSRGCAPLMPSVHQTCDHATKGEHHSCVACVGSLCNRYN